MTKTESGEIEVLLGSKQLLSVFFIVVILLGVFFAIGYIVGRNSNPPQVVETGGSGSLPRAVLQPDGTSAPVEIGRNGNPPRGDESKPMVVTPADIATQKPDPVAPVIERKETAENKPAAVETKPKVEPVPAKEKAAAETKEKKAKKDEKKPAEAETAGTNGRIHRGAPRSGHYLQLAAIPEKDANMLASVLQRKGFSVQLSAAAKEDLRRVLVGPVAEKKDLTQLRKTLDEAGFDGKKAIARKFGAAAAN